MLVMCLIGVTHVPCNTEINFKTMIFKWNLIVMKLTKYFNYGKNSLLYQSR